MSQSALHSSVRLVDPEYVYPLSQNPYGLKLQDFQSRVYSDNSTEKHRGFWRSAFPDAAEHSPTTRPLNVEIGCSAGHVSLEWAARNPAHAYMGIDWKFKMIHKGADKSVKRGLRNLVFLRAHADRLHYMFGPGEIDFLYLYFPDPWPRTKQWKNRWLTVENLRHAAAVVKPGGVFHIKTDHDGYFDWMLDRIAKVPELWQATELTRDLHEGNDGARALKIPDVTLFEGLFIKDGIRIKSVKLVRR